MNHREHRRAECQKLFAGFEPDYSRSRTPDQLRRVLAMAADGMFSHEIAEALGLSAKAVQKMFRRYNFPALQNFCPPLQHERVGWKGGLKEVKGYIYKRTPGHPYASKHGNYVAVHRLVLEGTLGRHLQPGEVVDHIDGDTRNNHPSNLRLFASNADHLRATLAGKCPAWTEDGLKALQAARTQPRRTWKGRSIAPTRAASETDAGQ